MLEIKRNQDNSQIHQEALVLPFNAVGIADIPLVGGKNASLGEMIQQLSSQGVKVPTGFATTAYA
ncbi:MAG: PEP/pyruvate-binding domain-containing protein, partial [Dolichospermum sp.]